MKVTKKNSSGIIILSILGILIGSLTWEILERIIILATGNTNLTLSLKNPIQIFDIYILSLSFRANPGTCIGFIGSIFFIKRIE